MELPPTKHRRTSGLAAVLRAVVVVAEMVMKVIISPLLCCAASAFDVEAASLSGDDSVMMWTQRILKTSNKFHLNRPEGKSRAFYGAWASKL